MKKSPLTTEYLTLPWHLQASGFRRVRNRRVGASSRASDPLGEGLNVFSGVRWLSPDDPCEAQLLSDGLARLVGTFPNLGGAIQLERLKTQVHPAVRGTRARARSRGGGSGAFSDLYVA
jgi:hypothetical protein